MNRSYQIYFLLLIIISCNYQNKTVPIIPQKTDSINHNSKTSTAKETINNVHGDELLPIPDFKNFEKYCETSGGLNNEGQKYLYRPKKGGIFGFYSLYDRKNSVLAGWLIIHSETEKLFDWKADDTTQSFIKIHLYNKGSSIDLFKGIGIGSNINLVIRELGEPQIQNDTIAIYWDRNRTIGIFKLVNKSITEIHYGRFNKKVSLPLTLNNIEILLKF